jgi:uncharacterized membrane protein
MAVAPPTISLKGIFIGKLPTSVTHGRSVTFPVSVANLGNISLTGKLTVNLFESSDAEFDGTNVLLGTVSNLRVNLKPGDHMAFRVRLRAPASVIAGQAYVAAVVASTGNAQVSSTVISQTALTFR